jgi:hypothetical protein
LGFFAVIIFETLKSNLFMKPNQKIFIGTIIFITTLAACSECGGRRIVIEDVATPQRFVLTTTQENPATIRIALSGNLNGRAAIGRIEIGPGKVYYNQLLDWYADTFVVKYVPIDATEGRVVLRYRY